MKVPAIHPKIRSLLRVASAMVAVTVVIASFSPRTPVVATGISDKVDHLAAYACLTFLLPLDWSGRVPGLAVAGGALELLQALVPGRQPDWGDAAVNTLGVLAGWLLASALLRMAGRLPKPGAVNILASK
jgi:VanZ family protein